MKSKNDVGLLTVVLVLFCVLSSVAAGRGLSAMVSKLNGWGAAAYAIVAAVFIGIAVVIVMQIISSLRDA